MINTSTADITCTYIKTSHWAGECWSVLPESYLLVVSGPGRARLVLDCNLSRRQDDKYIYCRHNVYLHKDVTLGR